jgi:hypothetical protein
LKKAAAAVGKLANDKGVTSEFKPTMNKKRKKVNVETDALLRVRAMHLANKSPAALSISHHNILFNKPNVQNWMLVGVEWPSQLFSKQVQMVINRINFFFQDCEFGDGLTVKRVMAVLHAAADAHSQTRTNRGQAQARNFTLPSFQMKPELRFRWPAYAFQTIVCTTITPQSPSPTPMTTAGEPSTIHNSDDDDNKLDNTSNVDWRRWMRGDLMYCEPEQMAGDGWQGHYELLMRRANFMKEVIAAEEKLISVGKDLSRVACLTQMSRIGAACSLLLGISS